MKYLKLFENINKPEIGDYVIMNDLISIYENLYGIIINTGKYNIHNDIIYLIEIETHINNEESERLKDKFKGNLGIIKDQNIPLKDENIVGTWAGSYPNYLWSLDEYFTTYKSKNEYDKAVEEIEMIKAANKYNL
jgi:hypothetical protein